MRVQIGLAIAVLLIGTSASAADIVARAEATELRYPSGRVAPRVVRDAEGQVTRLLLNEMQLSPEELAEVGRLERLRALVLLGTNVTDDDLKLLVPCKSLDHLNLTRTEVTDVGLDTILKLEHLQSLCLGDVSITPLGIEKLKERNRTSDQRLRWGYSQRME